MWLSWLLILGAKFISQAVSMPSSVSYDTHVVSPAHVPCSVKVGPPHACMLWWFFLSPSLLSLVSSGSNKCSITTTLIIMPSSASWRHKLLSGSCLLSSSTPVNSFDGSYLVVKGHQASEGLVFILCNFWNFCSQLHFELIIKLCAVLIPLHDLCVNILYASVISDRYRAREEGFPLKELWTNDFFAGLPPRPRYICWGNICWCGGWGN